MKIAVRIEKSRGRRERALSELLAAARSGAQRRGGGAGQVVSLQNDEVSYDVIQPGAADSDFRGAQD